MFDWVLNMPLSLYAVIGVRVVASRTIYEQSIKNFPFQNQGLLRITP